MASGARGRGFESRIARQKNKRLAINSAGLFSLPWRFTPLLPHYLRKSYFLLDLIFSVPLIENGGATGTSGQNDIYDKKINEFSMSRSVNSLE